MSDYYADGGENLKELLAQEVAREAILEEIRDGNIISIRAKRCRCGRFTPCDACKAFTEAGQSEWDRALREIGETDG